MFRLLDVVYGRLITGAGLSTDGAVGAFTLVEPANPGTVLTLGGATLKFDLSSTGADSLNVTAGSAAVSGTNMINITGLGSSLTAGSYPLITAAGGLGVSSDFRLSASTISVGGTTYSLCLNNSSNAESLTVSLAGSPVVRGSWSNANGGNWLTATNWSSSSVPGLSGSASANDTSTFGTESSSGSIGITLDTNVQLSAMSFTATSSYVLSGTGTLTLSATNGTALVTASSGALQTIAAPLVLASSADFAPAAGTQLTLSGTISGAGALSQTDAGTLVLSGTSNTYSGGTYVDACTLIANNSGAIPDG